MISQNRDGAEWSAIGDGTGSEKVDEFGSSTGALYSVAVIGNDLYVGGAFNRMDGVAANSVARWNGTHSRRLAEASAT